MGGGELLTPTIPQDLISGCFALRASTKPGSRSATPVGGFLPNQAPKSFCFCSVFGGYLGGCVSEVAVGTGGTVETDHSMGAGSPLNQSGMKTWCFCSWLVARMSAP